MTQENFNQSDYLSVLAQAPADSVKTFADSLLPRLGDVEVLTNRTGLVMLPYTDTVQGSTFHLGEVLVAEARVRIGEQEGYGSVLGRDLQQALAVAVLDTAVQSNLLVDKIMAFVNAEAKTQAAAQELLLRQVEATRVEMETF
jgi:alpha-D-ribose 1-methylphosphonate 5-triphosphate synthase subunit PhnG